MKQILFILLAALSFSSQAQIHINSFSGNSFYGVIKDNSDTFEIKQLGKIHFIKIEGEVYEITRKTELKKVTALLTIGDLKLAPYYAGDSAWIADTTNLYFDARPCLNLSTITDSNGKTYQFDEQTMTWKVIDKEQPKKKGKKK